MTTKATRTVKNTRATEATMNATIEEIAARILNLDTLETRNSDDLDFSDLAVWTIRDALEAAYDAGKTA